MIEIKSLLLKLNMKNRKIILSKTVEVQKHFCFKTEG